jgi:putative endonuclease
MEFCVYAIKSKSHNYIYVGMTKNLDMRIYQHNMGRSRATKPYAPFELIYREDCHTRVDARAREKYFKSGSGKEFLKSLL